MFIKNFTSSDLTLNLNGSSIILTANATTLIPDGLTTLAELQRMFGKETVVEVQSGPSTSIMSNQQVLTTGKLYLTDPRACTEVRLFVGSDGTVDVYGSDSQTIPAAFTNMSCPDGNQGVTGTCFFGSIPRYVAFKTNSGAPEIIATNCVFHEVKSIS